MSNYAWEINETWKILRTSKVTESWSFRPMKLLHLFWRCKCPNHQNGMIRRRKTGIFPLQIATRYLRLLQCWYIMSTCTAKTAPENVQLAFVEWITFLDLAATFKSCVCDKQSSTRCKTVVSLKRFLVNVIHQAICSCSDSEQPVESPKYSFGLERVLFTEKKRENIF